MPLCRPASPPHPGCLLPTQPACLNLPPSLSLPLPFPLFASLSFSPVPWLLNARRLLRPQLQTTPDPNIPSFVPSRPYQSYRRLISATRHYSLPRAHIFFPGQLYRAPLSRLKSRPRGVVTRGKNEPNCKGNTAAFSSAPREGTFSSPPVNNDFPSSLRLLLLGIFSF